jgi:hexosaminidase
MTPMAHHIVAGGALALMLGLAGAASPQSPAPSIVPQPARVERHDGTFVLSPATRIHVTEATRDLGYLLADLLRPATGLRLQVTGQASAARGVVLSIDPAMKPDTPDAYHLEVTRSRITIRGAAPAGVFYAIQTLRQLLPPDIFRDANIEHVKWEMPAVVIEDTPRFAWRGAMLDVSRHFMPKEFVKKFIDLLAIHKMNSFHWHLTDDQGWRIEIKRYPRLTEIGAWRKETIVGKPSKDPALNVFDHERHGGFYTQDDVREIVAYARERFINVVPEIEMPGHSQAAIAAYPELGNLDQPLEVSTTWGVHQNILNPEESTIRFMENVLTEVMDLFPSQYIHIGGDEADKTQWRASAKVQARMRQLGLKDEAEMQSYFTRQIDTFLAAHGRRLLGWDEILEGGLAQGATVMSWRGVAGGVAAARAEHNVVMAPTSHTYFDYYQTSDTESEPLAIGGLLPLETVYQFDPIPSELSPAQSRHVLGAQGQIWTEYIKGPKQVEFMAFPRLSALAEVLWTPPARRNFDDFNARLTTHLRRLSVLDVNYRPQAAR